MPLDEEALEKVILNLTKHFDRTPTEKEVHDFMFSSRERREEIYKNKGL